MHNRVLESASTLFPRLRCKLWKNEMASLISCTDILSLIACWWCVIAKTRTLTWKVQCEKKDVGTSCIILSVPWHMLLVELYVIRKTLWVGLTDHLKIVQVHFVVLWLLKFYFMPTLNIFRCSGIAHFFKQTLLNKNG